MKALTWWEKFIGVSDERDCCPTYKSVFFSDDINHTAAASTAVWTTTTTTVTTPRVHYHAARPAKRWRK